MRCMPDARARSILHPHAVNSIMSMRLNCKTAKYSLSYFQEMEYMKVLLVSVTAGYGHHATANAVAEGLTRRGAIVEKSDLLKYVSQLIFHMVDKGYLFYAKYAPRQYGQLYRLMEKSSAMKKYTITMFAAELLADKYNTYIREFNPDVIVATHFFSAQILDELKRRGEIDCPIIGIITDYTIHPFWNEMDCLDYFVTASELLNYEAEQKGIDLERVLPFGIPVHPKFMTKLEKREARQRLSIPPDKYTMLFMSGSMGHGDMVSMIEQVDALRDDLQILCVCGNNEKLCKKLKKLKTRNSLNIYGFVDNVELLMDAANCIVTKPGGLTVSEALSKKLPMILVDAIPGQEENNVDFLLNNGLAVHVTKRFSIGQAVYYLLSKPEKLTLMERGIDLLAHPDSTDRLCDFVMDLGERR